MQPPHPPPGDLRRARFERLYDETSAKVLGYALRRVAARENAADVVAETFTIAWRRLEDIPDGDQARLWLYGVARRVLANQRRGHARQVRLGQRLRDEVAGALAAVPHEPAEGAVPAALARLSEADREVLRLAAWEELGHEQIASVLGCSKAAARVRLHRARKRFAARLAEARMGTGTAPLPPAWAGANQDRRRAL